MASIIKLIYNDAVRVGLAAARSIKASSQALASKQAVQPLYWLSLLEEIVERSIVDREVAAVARGGGTPPAVDVRYTSEARALSTPATGWRYSQGMAASGEGMSATLRRVTDLGWALSMKKGATEPLNALES
jgi:hypothetical protein